MGYKKDKRPVNGVGQVLSSDVTAVDATLTGTLTVKTITGSSAITALKVTASSGVSAKTVDATSNITGVGLISTSDIDGVTITATSTLSGLNITASSKGTFGHLLTASSKATVTKTLTMSSAAVYPVASIGSTATTVPNYGVAVLTAYLSSGLAKTYPLAAPVAGRAVTIYNRSTASSTGYRRVQRPAATFAIHTTGGAKGGIVFGSLNAMATLQGLTSTGYLLVNRLGTIAYTT